MPARRKINDILTCSVRWITTRTRRSVYDRIATRNTARMSTVANQFKNRIHDYHSASVATEYVRGDPMVNLLKISHRKGAGKITQQNVSSTHPHLSDTYFCDKGKEFEANIVEVIKRKFATEFIDIDGWSGISRDDVSCVVTNNATGDTAGAVANTTEPTERTEPTDIADKLQTTIAHMSAGTPIIYQGVVWNAKAQLYGFPDFMIRNDFLNQLIEMPPDTPNVMTNINGVICNYHYVIVDVKWSTLLLLSNGINVGNSGSHKSHKAQLSIYNTCLGVMQSYTPAHAYIMGKGCKYTSRSNTTTIRGAFKKLGVIDFKNYGLPDPNAVAKAISWVDDATANHTAYMTELLTADGSAPLSRMELYPNMSISAYSSYHQHFKHQLADRIGEITQCWQCGASQRANALRHGIHSWKDPRFNASVAGLKGKRGELLDAILATNRSDRSDRSDRSNRSNRSNRMYHIPNEAKKAIRDMFAGSTYNDLYVDFETTNLSVVDTSPDGIDGPSTLIFMIGVGWQRMDGSWGWCSFDAQHFTVAEEERICAEFAELVSGWNNPRLLHYHHAEPVHWKGAIAHSRTHGTNKLAGAYYQQLFWCDMYKLFTDNLITVKGALNYQLKTISKALQSHGLIASTWNDDISDGGNAMLLAIDCEQRSIAAGKSITDMPEFNSIVYYNEIDCKVLFEIKKFLMTQMTVRRLRQ